MAPKPPTGRRPSRALPLRWSAALLVCLGAAWPAAAQQPANLPANLPAPGHVTQGPAPAQPYTLGDCVRAALEHQPSLAAARASVAAAEAQRHALERLVVASVISREMPYRRQQACLGVQVAQAGLRQGEHEAVYAVTRNYFTYVYARQQETLVRGLVDRLKTFRDLTQAAVKKGLPDGPTQIDVDRLAVNIDLNQVRVVEAQQGAERALAALREAMALAPDCPLSLATEPLPPLGQLLDRQQLVALALARRGELAQAGSAAQIFDLEIHAQDTSLALTMQTFAATADIHARPIPQGVSNATYRPSAVGVEMPTQLAGRRPDRVERARDLAGRAGAVVEKTRNLIVLETEDTFLKWQDAYRRVQTLEQAPARAIAMAKAVRARFDDNKANVEEYLRAETLRDQVEAQLNEAMYLHALAVAALERVTAGGLVPGYRHQAVVVER
jgi:outer membrane protein TolC